MPMDPAKLILRRWEATQNSSVVSFSSESVETDQHVCNDFLLRLVRTRRLCFQRNTPQQNNPCQSPGKDWLFIVRRSDFK